MIDHIFLGCIFINAAVFLLYGADKYRSKWRRKRMKESTLLSAALFGPFGALGAMWMFHHKTRKLKFVAVPTIMGMHVVLAILLMV